MRRGRRHPGESWHHPRCLDNSCRPPNAPPCIPALLSGHPDIPSPMCAQLHRIAQTRRASRCEPCVQIIAEYAVSWLSCQSSAELQGGPWMTRELSICLLLSSTRARRTPGAGHGGRSGSGARSDLVSDRPIRPRSDRFGRVLSSGDLPRPGERSRRPWGRTVAQAPLYLYFLLL